MHILAICLFIQHSLVFAQQDAFTFTNYSTANGLADNMIRSILQDSRGFMWFGTGEGLSRFDGTNFKNFFAQKNDSNSLPGNIIASLIEFKPGHLVMVSSGTLTCLNTITQQFYQPKEFLQKQVSSVIRLDSNRYSVNKFDTSFITDSLFNITDILAPLTVRQAGCNTFFLDSLTWLVGSPFEYFIYHPKEKKLAPFITQAQMPEREKILMFHYYDKVNKWLYFTNYDGGLFRYSLGGKILYNWKVSRGSGALQNGNISFIAQKNDSILWLGNAENYGLNILNIHTNLVTTIVGKENDPSSLIGNSILCGYTDHSGNEWLTTSEGVSKLNNSTASIKNWMPDPGVSFANNPLLRIIRASDGQLYVASFGSWRCYRINQDLEKNQLLDTTRFPTIWCMNTFGNEIVFTGGSISISMYNPLTNQYRQTDFLKKYFPYSDVVILAFKHSNGDEWYSGNNGGGFVRIAANDGSIHTYKKNGPRGDFLSSYYAYHLEDKNGDLWFGVNKSSRLVHWSKTRDYFTEVAFDNMPGIPQKHHAGITDITMDSESNIWISFDGTGVIKYNPSSHNAAHFTIADGLPTNYVYGLKFDDKGRLWIGTLKGLSCLLVNENRFVNFKKEDGLPADYFDERCIYFDSSSHQLFIASRNRLMKFDPDVLLTSTQGRIPLYIDEVFVNGRNYYNINADQQSFAPTQNNLQFRFIGVDINNGKDIEYSYKLTGADADWIYNDNITTASYANLAPGDYVFTVRARHRGDTAWSAMQVPLNFTIQTPWQKTIWFKTLLVLAASLLVWFMIRSYYARKLEKQKAILEKKQAIEKERTRIATDMHDDFGASLSRIKFLSEKLQLQKKNAINQSQDLSKISAYSDEMAEKMGEIVWALNQRYDSTGDLVSFCRSYASEYLEGKSIKLDFSTGELTELKIHGEIRRNIFLVMKESLHNIIKHAAASEVKICIACDEGLHMTVHDNGRGFDISAVRPFANGLENMKKRIEGVGGYLSIENGKGTKISIIIPARILQNTYR